MYRLLERFRPARKNSRRSTRAAIHEVADRSREPVESAVEITTAHNCWEASDQRRDTNAASLAAFVFLESDLRSRTFSGIWLRLYLHPQQVAPLRRFAGDCTIKLAYQAAEANHPG
jgi:hypothetical protein